MNQPLRGNNNVLPLSHECKINVLLPPNPRRVTLFAARSDSDMVGLRGGETQDATFHTGEPTDWHMRTGDGRA